jgi:uncharacterized tellurite resistance protein B-like protein
MFNQLLRLLQEPPARTAPDLRLSVAVLLLEAARQDDHFDVRERAVIADMLSRRFDLTAEQCAALMAQGEAQASQMVQLHGHTSAILEQMDEAGRIGMIEMLWRVAYADGVLDPEEDLLIRRVAGLIHVSDRDRVLARQRALAQPG